MTGESISLVVIDDDELVAAAGTKRTVSQSVVERLVKDGRLQKLGKGTKGSPFRFWSPPPNGQSVLPVPLTKDAAPSIQCVNEGGRDAAAP